MESLGIDCPLTKRVFVVNLSYNVDEAKLREIFKMAGHVQAVELFKDADGKSRGRAAIEVSRSWFKFWHVFRVSTVTDCCLI